jgi:hypothetical protein
MAAESKLQRKIINSLKRKKWLVTKIMLSSMNGWPDVEAIKNGRTIRLELKAPGEDAEPLQKYVHSLIKSHGGEVYKIDSWEGYQKLKL